LETITRFKFLKGFLSTPGRIRTCNRPDVSGYSIQLSWPAEKRCVVKKEYSLVEDLWYPNHLDAKRKEIG